MVEEDGMDWERGKDIHRTISSICCARIERCLFFFASARALSCLMVAHLLWPERAHAVLVRLRVKQLRAWDKPLEFFGSRDEA